MKLRASALGMAFDIALGLWIFVATIWAVIAERGYTVAFLGEYWFGNTVRYGWAFPGLRWGIVYGFIFGALVAWLYNTFSKALYKSEAFGA